MSDVEKLLEEVLKGKKRAKNSVLKSFKNIWQENEDLKIKLEEHINFWVKQYEDQVELSRGHRDELSAKTEQLEKYAELGRLAVKMLDEWDKCGITPIGFIGELRNKRAELLAGEKI